MKLSSKCVLLCLAVLATMLTACSKEEPESVDTTMPDPSISDTTTDTGILDDDFGDESIPEPSDFITDETDPMNSGELEGVPDEWLTDDTIGTPIEETPIVETPIEPTEPEPAEQDEVEPEQNEEEPVRLPSTGIFFDEES